jgi:hypothetical protein
MSLTWAEFKESVESQEVTDSDNIEYIDWSDVHGQTPEVQEQVSGDAPNRTFCIF